MRICERLSVLFLNCYLITAIQKEDLLPYGLSKSDSIFLAGEDEISKVLKLKKPLQFYNAQFSDIYVATNGLLSLQPPPREGEYVSRGFPLGFPAIAPFLTDVDTSRGRGAVYYRYEDSLDILDMAAKVVQSGFTGFRPTHAVIVTWDHVASYEEVNTFQVVLAGNETDTYALFLYPEDGLQFFGTRLKPPHSPSVELPARVGFSRGEASITEEHYYSLTTSEQTASDLHTKGNSGTRGVWLFHIGSSRFSFQSIIPATSGRVPPVASPWGLASGLGGTEKPVATGTELPRPVPSQSSLPDVTETCPLFLQRCSQDSYCTDHPAGPCCHCRSGYYGNGRHCLPKGVSQRQNGRVDGLVSVGASQVQLDGVYLHGYAVVGEGRVYVSVSPVPEQAGWALMTVSPLVSMFGWLFALELRNHQNGFSITGAEFIHHSEMTFYPGNQHLTVVHKAQGVDSFNHLKMETRIHGDLPNIPLGAKVHIQPYKETYQYNHSVVTSSSLRDYTVASENGGSETFSYLLRQNVTFQGCGRGPLTIPDFQQLNVEHALVMYAEEGNILRYTLTNTVGPVGGELPELVEVNPCSSGKHYCDPMALCLPGEGVLYHCQCAMGFRGDGHNCYDVDECTEGLSSCGPHSQCVNMPGSHHCHCDAGYEFDFDWRACVDIDECWLKLCHSFASCSNSQGSFQCQCWPGYEGDGFLCQPRMCVTEQPRRPLAMCEQHRTSLQEGLSSWGGRPVEGAFIPKCDEEGQYSPTQCFGSTGHCWCVDSRGQERAGTWTLPGTPPVNCDNSPLVPRTETLCERWRQTLLSHYGGQPSPRDYLPQCGAQGHFLSVQCYGNSTFCWCVDKQGREVTGTRSHDAVRPACISTDPPLAQPFLYPEVTSRPTGPAILFAQAAQIGLIPLNGIHLDKDKSSVLLALQDSIVVGLDYECLENKLYWTDLMRQSISRVSLVPGAEPEIIINSGLTSPEGLAVDARHRKLFWVDSGTERIEVSELDGRGRKVLFDSDLVNPRAIVVDSSSGTLFWTDWDRDDPKIESSTLEGHERKVLVREGIGLPNALTLDPITRHLCWADAGTKRLECMAPDGTERKIIHSRLDYPFSLVNHGNHAYYTDWERDGILVLDKDTSRFTEYLPVQRAHLYGITVISSHCAAGRN